MITPAEADVTALRTQAFIKTIDLAGIDLSTTGADVVAQVRLLPGTPGDPLIDFRYSGGDTEITFTELRHEAGVPVSTIRITAVEQVVRNLPRVGELGDPTPLHWDMQVKAGDATEGVYQTLIRGRFTVEEGVTVRG